MALQFKRELSVLMLATRLGVAQISSGGDESIQGVPFDYNSAMIILQELRHEKIRQVSRL